MAGGIAFGLAAVAVVHGLIARLEREFGHPSPLPRPA